MLIISSRKGRLSGKRDRKKLIKIDKKSQDLRIFRRSLK
jgi:hypothetical protein